LSLANELKCTLDAPEAEIDLTRAATLLARLEYPQLDIVTCDQQIRGYAEVIAERLSDATFNRPTPFGTIDIINRHLFDEVGLHGNEDDYYNPRNSFINEVLERRGGIPITLSVIYLEVARHLGLPIFGVALPGHFVVKYDDGKWRHFIDVFARGRVLDKDGCRELIRRLNSNIEVTEGMFAAVSKRAIIDRMLNNLRATYLHRRQYRKALAVLDVILALEPNALDNIRQRAWLRSETNQSSLAVADLEKYLKLCPKAEDADELRGWVQKVKRDLIALN
jgi:regulator of sirC expression with transglutaminase-like and TPR domain